ncbi:hypothetical protein IB276_25995 [Ensifer sp. ENS04]|nr:hypothetical protein [Ensifer sp. ENS04]MBD9542902.1 hypothetical protein [Ensifer sp. ENS04]
MAHRNDTFITLKARFALWVVIAVGGALLVGGTAAQAVALDRQWEIDSRT